MGFFSTRKAQQDVLVGLPALLVTFVIVGIFLAIAVTITAQTHATLVQSSDTGQASETMNFDTGSDSPTEQSYCTGVVSIVSKVN